jgi:enamine deaminase RidA (YjgF/YER057c/UK114 family)
VVPADVRMTDSPTSALAREGIDLPPPPTPKGTYAPAVLVGRDLYVSGQVPLGASGEPMFPGRVGEEVTLAQAREAARRAMLQALSAAAQVAGSLDRIERIVRVVVFVASAPGFHEQHEVANGATELLERIWGPELRPVRSSVGVASLPLNFPVEIELQARTV